MDALAQNAWAWTALAYFVAAIPVGVVLAKLRGIDLREVGSGNIGATNAARALGARLGVVVLVLDAAKAGIPVWLSSQSWALGDTPDAEVGVALVGLAAVLGHIFPIYLRFRGGKGVACALGVFLAIDWPVGVVALVMYLQGIILTRTSAIGSLTAVTAATCATLIADKHVAFQMLCAAVAVVIWVRHTSNIRGLIEEAKARKRARGEIRPPGR